MVGDGKEFGKGNLSSLVTRVSKCWKLPSVVSTKPVRGYSLMKTPNTNILSNHMNTILYRVTVLGPCACRRLQCNVYVV